MSIATLLIPIRVGLFDRSRPVGRHRALDEIDRQQALRAGADLLIKALRQQLEDQEIAHAETIARIDERHAEVVEQLQWELAEARQRIAIASHAETVVTKTQEMSVDEIRKHCVMPLHQAPFATTDPGRT